MLRNAVETMASIFIKHDKHKTILYSWIRAFVTPYMLLYMGASFSFFFIFTFKANKLQKKRIKHQFIREQKKKKTREKEILSAYLCLKPTKKCFNTKNVVC